jgi:1,4-alpha-glucan branching enzyme
MSSITEKFTKKNVVSRKSNFEYFAPESKEVQIAGTFNDWKPVNLTKSGEGKWAIALDLKPGRYEYRYLVDGTWQNDQRPVECVPNNFGTWNCVLEIRD